MTILVPQAGVSVRDKGWECRGLDNWNRVLGYTILYL